MTGPSRVDISEEQDRQGKPSSRVEPKEEEVKAVDMAETKDAAAKVVADITRAVIAVVESAVFDGT